MNIVRRIAVPILLAAAVVTATAAGIAGDAVSAQAAACPPGTEVTYDLTAQSGGVGVCTPLG
ncbi:hypothetical protein [Spirillospora sp. NPDC029432]|uniref:hypothetical protein n=1 Tax=Spirillospora sp. NPDC029432 TaxID=3154599 RepID=UPI0034540FF2